MFSGTTIALNKIGALSISFPVRKINEERLRFNEMKTLKQIFLILAITVGASMAASAQQDKDQKQRPPKDPPKIVPEKEKEKPRENRPKDDDRNNDNRGKKPQMFVSKTTGETEIYFG